MLAWVVTRDGLPPAHLTLAGNARDLQTVEAIVTTIEARFGESRRVRVMDRGMISKGSLKFLGRSGRRYLLATGRGESAAFAKHLRPGGRRRLTDNPDVEVELLKRRRVDYLLARSRPRRQEERAIRRRRRRGLARALEELQERIRGGRLKGRDKILEGVGRLKGRFPEARPFVTITAAKAGPAQLSWRRDREEFRAALAGDGADLLRSDPGGWSAEELWETYIPLTVVEHAFRVLKGELLLRPAWHHYSGRTRAPVMICVPAYAPGKAPDHLAERAGPEARIHEPDPHRPGSAPKPRPMTPEVLLRESGRIAIGDIELGTTDGQRRSLRRVAGPMGEQERILEALRWEIPEGLSRDRIVE